MPVDIIELIGQRRPPLTVIDLGALDIGDEHVPYAPLRDLPDTQIIGFEPLAEECAKLNETAAKGQRFLPYAIGDGKVGTFRVCRFPATSSLYPPNHRLLRRFSSLPEALEVLKEVPMETHRLDDVPEVKHTDYLKIDVQGASLDVVRGAPETLKNVSVIHVEVEFIPLYEGQPLFGDVDAALREAGFLFHRFAGTAARTFAPFKRKTNDGRHGQVLWGEAVYVTSFMNFAEQPPEKLLKTALIVQLVYGSSDLAALALQHYDALEGTDLWDRYTIALTGNLKEKPPLD